MTRLTDTLIASGKAFSQGKQTPMVDPQHGAQQGYQTDFSAYVSNSAYVKRNLIALLVEAPRGFQDLDDPDRYVNTLKALVELHARTIDGLNATLTVDFVENAVGGAGEVQQDVGNVTRARSEPVFTWTEKYGKPVQSFLESWIINLIMEPGNKVPAVVTRGTRRPTDLLPDYNSMTVMFIEPDPTHTKVQTAWLCTNMKPNGAGDKTGRRDLTAGGESLDISVTFSALTQVGVGVDKFAQQLLDELNLTGSNPNLRPAFVDSIEADVKRGESGYINQVNNASKTAVSV